MAIGSDIAGKRVVVTGAGTGIGRGVALKFAEYGADVVLHYSHSDAGAKSATEEIQGMGRKAAALQADFNNVDDVFRMAAEAEEFLGQIDILVNNAGITTNLAFTDVQRQYPGYVLHDTGCGKRHDHAR
jgi:NAD(P)-dependent dehydrogenase (short-subunit alcohol dehydrogenase family)